MGRSNMYHLISTSHHVDHKRSARFDAWGGVFVIALLLIVVEVVRRVIAH